MDLTSGITIRALQEADRDEWIRMRLALWPECPRERHMLEMKQLIGHPGRAQVLVAVRPDTSLCGFAEVSVRHDHVDGASSVPVAYLEGWYLDPDLRNKGIGRKILEAVEDWARERGLTELASDAESHNEQSIAAHRSCGFVETCRAVHFIKIVGTGRKRIDLRSP